MQIHVTGISILFLFALLFFIPFGFSFSCSSLTQYLTVCYQADSSDAKMCRDVAGSHLAASDSYFSAFVDIAVEAANYIS
jgi:hypothetical protein